MDASEGQEPVPHDADGSAPSPAVPANGARRSRAGGGITLTFPEPLDEAALARMVTLELRPLPGVEPGGGALPRPARTSRSRSSSGAPGRRRRATSSSCAQPIPLGTRAIVHLRLCLDDTADRSFAESPSPPRSRSGCSRWAAARPRCRSRSPAGTRYSARAGARTCEADARAVVVRVLGDAARRLGPGRGAQPGAASPRRWTTSSFALERHEPGGERRLRPGDPLPGRPGARAAHRHPAAAPSRCTARVEVVPPSRARRRSCAGARARGSSSASGRRWSRSRAAATSASTCASTASTRSTAPSGRSPTAAGRGRRVAAPARTRRGAGALHRSGPPHPTSGSCASTSRPRLPAGLDPRRPAAAARGRAPRRFGLDLGAAPRAARRQGAAPGHYLVGSARPRETGDERHWMRLQVTDLA